MLMNIPFSCFEYLPAYLPVACLEINVPPLCIETCEVTRIKCPSLPIIVRTQTPHDQIIELAQPITGDMLIVNRTLLVHRQNFGSVLCDRPVGRVSDDLFSVDTAAHIYLRFDVHCVKPHRNVHTPKAFEGRLFPKFLRCERCALEYALIAGHSIGSIFFKWQDEVRNEFARQSFYKFHRVTTIDAPVRNGAVRRKNLRSAVRALIDGDVTFCLLLSVCLIHSFSLHLSLYLHSSLCLHHLCSRHGSFIRARAVVLVREKAGVAVIAAQLARVRVEAEGCAAGFAFIRCAHRSSFCKMGCRISYFSSDFTEVPGKIVAASVNYTIRH